MNGKSLAKSLQIAVESAIPSLMELEEEKVGERSAPGKWSKKEILGHLIDSAANNHQRFIRAQQQGNMVFNGYVQDEWVKQSGYQDTPWEVIVGLWASYNLHLARVIFLIPDEVVSHMHQEHNLDRIAYKTVPATESTNLAYFIEDYIDHLQHHLRQIIE